jgi:hypothetical protein
MVTIKKLAKRLGVDYITAKGLVNIGVNMGTTKVIGSARNENGKGRPSVLYSVPDFFIVDLSLVEKKNQKKNQKKKKAA